MAPGRSGRAGRRGAVVAGSGLWLAWCRCRVGDSKTSLSQAPGRDMRQPAADEDEQ